ncbi:sensor histidine kinase/response regulator [Caballeronia novacaledonica]|uniref:histidine kinase n=1 Tax=Caballeronia novacaledonica TaxID=1544861 RepID=A0A2U3IFK9_9BURK|nr:hybrid sensor histidine kinase/response regulator [Caballeronia novacaledonica]SPB18915.1 sensor histidine kinase/response regulator [Caballeronia novacaledonica]
MNESEEHAGLGAAEPLPSLPPLDFRAARRRLFAALVASIVIPLAFFCLYGYYTYERALSETGQSLERMVRVIDERANTVFSINHELIVRIEDMLGNGDENFIARSEPELHDALARLAQSHAQIAALSVLDSRGRLILSSRFFPAPNVSIGDRADFIAARDTHATFHVSMPERGRVKNTDIINTLSARFAKDGRFLGEIAIAVRRDYLIDFYRELAASDPALTLALHRDDGAVLARYPPASVANPPDRHLVLAEAFVQGKSTGLMRYISPLDNDEKLAAWRRVGGFPVYAAAGFAIHDIRVAWWRRDVSIASIGLIPCIALWLLIGFSLRRLQAEEAAWHNWRGELALRRSAIAATRRLQRMGALGNLVANVAHDFNNLLMVVTANMEMARRKGFNNLEKEVTAVERASNNAQSLARRLLSVARRQPLQTQVIRLDRWMTESEPLVRASVGDKVTFGTRVPDATWPVRVDATELTSALINIAVNAKDAMPNGGDFQIACSNVRYAQTHDGLGAGEYVVISCRDSGMGMRPEVARQAFEPLFTTKGAGAGTGLGLAQVLAMAEQAGGTARANSAWGFGTTIDIYLPHWTGETEALADAPPVETIERPALSTTVLLVEDNEEVAAGLCAVLDVLGWQTRHAASGDAAKQMLEAGNAFDLVLSDIQMPGNYDGIKLAEWIKATRPKQPVTLMTGYADQLDEARRTGFAILAKPFNIDDLQRLLNGLSMRAAK